MRVSRSMRTRSTSYSRVLLGLTTLSLFYIVVDLSIRAVQYHNVKSDLRKRGWELYPAPPGRFPPLCGFSLPNRYSTGFGTFGVTEATFWHFGEFDDTFILDQEDAIITCQQPGLRGLSVYCQHQTLQSTVCQAIGKAEHLETLCLGDFNTTDAGAMRLILGSKTLRNLRIHGHILTDDELDEIACNRHLRELYLWKTKITKSKVAELRSRMPLCEIRGFNRTLEPD